MLGDTNSRKRPNSGPNSVDLQTLRQQNKRASILNSSARARSALQLTDPGPVIVAEAGSSSAEIQYDSRSPVYRCLGLCDHVCEFCGALFWYAERVSPYSSNHRPRYNMCCKGGKVKLPLPLQPPQMLKSLLNDNRFRCNIRAYNSMFSMTSFGAQVDESVNRGSGPYVFKVEGQISHWIGSVCPMSNSCPRFLQLYIYDTRNEVDNRMRFFDSPHGTPISSNAVHDLIEMLNQSNELVKLMRTTRDLCLEGTVPYFAIRLYSERRHSTYDTPTAGTLGAIILDDAPLNTDFDIIITSKDGSPKRISKLHSLYMSLQYPLLFPFVEQGWSPNLRLRSC